MNHSGSFHENIPQLFITSQGKDSVFNAFMLHFHKFNKQTQRLFSLLPLSAAVEQGSWKHPQLQPAFSEGTARRGARTSEGILIAVVSPIDPQEGCKEVVKRGPLGVQIY